MSITSLCTGNELVEFEIKGKILLALSPCPKYVQDQYEEKYKTLMKGIKKKLNKWSYSPCSWIERVLSRCQFFPTRSTYSKQFQ